MAGNELVDIVDEANTVCGATTAEVAHDQKLRHRVVGVFVFDSDGSLLLQEGGKYGKLDISVGGHVRQGESYGDAAVREMQEELGLTVPIMHVSTFLPEHARMNHYWAIYTASAPHDWEFAETEEVPALKRMSRSSIRALLGQDPEAFTHGFRNTFGELERLRPV